MNAMDINGCQAVVSYAPDINQFHGEFIELNGGAVRVGRESGGMRRPRAADFSDLRMLLERIIAGRRGQRSRRPSVIIHTGGRSLPRPA